MEATMARDSKSPTTLAEALVDALMEAGIAADFYATKKNKAPYIERFIQHMYRVQKTSDALCQAMHRDGDQFRAVCDSPIDGRSPSVHDHLGFVGMDVTGDIAGAMMTAWAKQENEPWPPKGEYEIPKLCCEDEFRQYIDVAIAAFCNRLSLDQLNAWSARLEQEIARAATRPASPSANSANTSKLFPGGVPRNPDLVDLTARIDAENRKPENERRSNNEIARELTHETKGNDKKAKSLLSQVRRMKQTRHVTL
jgi:hypothetical protein